MKTQYDYEENKTGTSTYNTHAKTELTNDLSQAVTTLCII
jgi:hypothetical protein